MDPNLENEDLQDEELELQDQQDEGNEEADGDAAGSDEEQADGGEGAEAEVREEPRQVSRGEKRFQNLSNSVREANQRAERLERELQQLRTERSQREAKEKEPTAEEMALWSVDQQVEYRLNKGMQGVNQTLQQLRFESAETADKTNFQTLCSRDARAAKYAGEVEERLAGLRAQGQNAPREAILRYLVGEKVLNQGAKTVAKQRQDGQRRIAQQRGGGAAPRSDAGGGRQAKTEAEKRLQRLENVTF